ncbi:MAG: antibiotic biosynthesis monooxygenase family protein [Bacteroidota bacterium]
MFTAISSFEILNGMENEVKQAFINRPRLAEKYEGFLGLDVLIPFESPSQIWLITNWTDEAIFNTWHKTHVRNSHAGIPKGLKLVPHSFKLRFFNHIAS